jgi:amino acid permease
MPVLTYLHIPVFILSFIGLEVWYRQWRRYTKVLLPKITADEEKKLQSFSPSEFEREVFSNDR